MAELVNRVYIDVDGEVIEAAGIDENIRGNKELVRVMNRRNRAIGHHHGVPEYGISVTFPADLELTLKFSKMLRNNTLFTVTVEDEGSDGTTRSRSYLDCEIYDISKSSKEGSSQEISLEITALDMTGDD